MTEPSFSRLRLIGGVVLGLCAVLLSVEPFSGVKLQFTDAISGFAAIGVGLLLLAEIGPLIKTFKAGGMEVDFVETVGDKFGALEKRIAQLELIKPPTGSATPRSAVAQAPALKLGVTDTNDPNKGRFGGKASDGGFTLAASFRGGASGWVDVRLTVTADTTVTLAPRDHAEVFLHDSFDPDRIKALFKDGVAELSVLAYGGFTVGIWIPSHGVQLELDLARVRGAPRVIRDL